MFSERLKELRQRRHMTQQQLAMRLEVSPSAIGMYEQGRREPDAELLRRVSRLFHVSTDYLLEVEPEKQSAELSCVINHLADKLQEIEHLTFHGRELEPEELQRVVNALKLSTRLAFSSKK